jgi:C-terminal processing protease CtpA/Prc
MIVYKKSTVDGKIKYTPETVELKVSKLKTERKSIKSDTWGFVVQMTSQGLPIITHVEPGSPAERAGLKPFSVVLVSVAAPQISDKPMVVDDLNKLKRMLIMLRESEAENLLLIALDINNRKKVINITLSRKEAKAPITEPVAKFNSHKRGAETYIAA